MAANASYNILRHGHLFRRAPFCFGNDFPYDSRRTFLFLKKKMKKKISCMLLYTPVDGLIFGGPCLLACVRVCTIQLREYLRIEPVFSLSRAIVYDNVVSRPLPLFNPKEKKEKKERNYASGSWGRIYTHTHTLRRGEWINNLGSQWSSFEFCVVIRSVGREKNKIIIFECALVKTENNQTGKNRNARMMRFFLLFYF